MVCIKARIMVLCVYLMMTGRVRAEDVLGDVVIIILQQLLDTDLFIKVGCVFLSVKLGLLLLPFNQDLSAYTISFLHFSVSDAKTSTGSYARFRQESIMEKASQWFVFLQTDTEREGQLFSCCGDKKSLLFLYPFS